jgi:hypothetical protein
MIELIEGLNIVCIQQFTYLSPSEHKSERLETRLSTFLYLQTCSFKSPEHLERNKKRVDYKGAFHMHGQTDLTIILEAKYERRLDRLRLL